MATISKCTVPLSHKLVQGDPLLNSVSGVLKGGGGGATRTGGNFVYHCCGGGGRGEGVIPLIHCHRKFNKGSQILKVSK